MYLYKFLLLLLLLPPPILLNNTMVNAAAPAQVLVVEVVSTNSAPQVKSQVVSTISVSQIICYCY